MAKYLLFGILSAAIAGCAAPAANLPPSQPGQAERSQPAERPAALYIGFAKVAGWVAAPTPDGSGSVLAVNERLGAQVQISVFPRSDGEPRDQIGWFMTKMMSKGAEIGKLDLPAKGNDPASMEFFGAAGGVNITGLAAAKVSDIDGLGLILIGLWPTENDAAARPEFYSIFGSVEIIRQ